MTGRNRLIASMPIAIFLIAGFSMFMPRPGRISAQTSYWTPQMSSYPTSDIGSFTNWPYNALPYQTSSWSQTYPNFSYYSLPTTCFGLRDYRLPNSYPVASQFRWGNNYTGFSPFDLASPFGWPNISFSLPSYTWPSSYPNFPYFPWLVTSWQPPVSYGSQPTSPQGVEAEEYAVYSAYIDRSEYGNREKILIRNHTATHIINSLQTQPSYLDILLDRLPEQMSGIVQDTIYDFFYRNQEAYPLGNYFDIYAQYELVDDTDPYKVLELSRVGFNSTRTQALFEVGYLSAPLAGHGTYVLMIKENGVWDFQNSSLSWIS